MTITPYRHRLVQRLLAKRRKSEGFTLIELLVVIVILGVLGAVGYQAYVNQIGRANANIAANTATAVAKNCASLLVTGDEAQFGDTVDQFLGGDATLDPETCAAPTTYTVTVGTGTFLRTADATVNIDGEVTPAEPDNTAPAPAPGPTP